jgi:F-type H+-transporting ATPase subunit delta
MKTSKISDRYAKALFDFSKEHNIIEEVYADMILINTTYSTSPDFAVAMKSPIIRPDRKIKIFSEIFKNNIHEISLTYLNIIFKKGRELYIHDIVYHFIKLYKVHHHIKEVIIITPSALDIKLKERLIAQLSNQLNCTIELIEKLDPTLIGGMVIKVDDQLIDTSISGQIKKLQQEFSTNIYSKAF